MEVDGSNVLTPLVHSSMFLWSIAQRAPPKGCPIGCRCNVVQILPPDAPTMFFDVPKLRELQRCQGFGQLVGNHFVGGTIFDLNCLVCNFVLGVMESHFYVLSSTRSLSTSHQGNRRLIVLIYHSWCIAPKKSNSPYSHTTFFVAVQSEMYSALVVESATHFCFLLPHPNAA